MGKAKEWFYPVTGRLCRSVVTATAISQAQQKCGRYGQRVFRRSHSRRKAESRKGYGDVSEDKTFGKWPAGGEGRNKVPTPEISLETITRGCADVSRAFECGDHLVFSGSLNAGYSRHKYSSGLDHYVLPAGRPQKITPIPHPTRF